MDLLEMNLLEKLGRKIAEQVPPAPAAEAAPEIVARLSGMEARIKEFQEKFLLGASQMKNIEESKIGARKEIEELLKVVREQQKYSELDRQMHDQLEKAWLRVEEMEKRLMDAYAAASTRPSAPPVHAPAPDTAELAAQVARAVESAIDARLKRLESSFKDLPAPAMRYDHAAAEARAREFYSSVEGRLAELAAELRQQRTDNFAVKQGLEDDLLEIRKELLSAVPEGVERGSGAFIRHADAAALDLRERLDALTKLLISHVDELSEAQRGEGVRMELLETALRREVAAAVEAVSGAQSAFRDGLEQHRRRLTEEMQAENSAQLERIKESLKVSSSGLAALSASASAVGGLETRLTEVRENLKALVKNLGSVNLEALLGVSGTIVRRGYETASLLITALDKELPAVSAAKAELEANMDKLRLHPEERK